MAEFGVSYQVGSDNTASIESLTLPQDYTVDLEGCCSNCSSRFSMCLWPSEEIEAIRSTWNMSYKCKGCDRVSYLKAVVKEPTRQPHNGPVSIIFGEIQTRGSIHIESTRLSGIIINTDEGDIKVTSERAEEDDGVILEILGDGGDVVLQLEDFSLSPRDEQTWPRKGHRPMQQLPMTTIGVAVRTDLDWPVGALAAQAVHAAGEVYARLPDPEQSANLHVRIFAARCLEDLQNMKKRAESASVFTVIWTEQPENYPTACVCGPCSGNQLRRIQGELQLWC